MRKSSLTPKQANAIGEVLLSRRQELGLSVRQLAAGSGVNIATIALLENRRVFEPRPGTLNALAQALNLPAADLYTLAGWLPTGELPTMRPYLRAKYGDLDDAAIADIERYAEQLMQRYGRSGPVAHEDEHT